MCVICYKGILMSQLHFFFLLGCFVCSSCSEDNTSSRGQLHNRTTPVEKSQKQPTKTTLNDTLKIKKNQVVIPRIIPPSPCPIDPEPIDPYPFEPDIQPEYFIRPECPPPPQTIHDSVVRFPAQEASFGKSSQELIQYIEQNISGSAEWKHLYELGISGKIYIRILIDTKGRVRDITFLRFTDQELEIMSRPLQSVLLSMPNWLPAKDQHGQSVVSEFTFPLRIEFY